MYALNDSAEGDCYLSVPPDPCIEAAALGASVSATPGTGESTPPGAGESALSGTAPTEALHTFTLDSGALRSFFRDSTTLTPLSRPVAVYLADPSGGPVFAHSYTILPCPVAPSGLLSGLHLPSFSTNLVSGADLQDAWVFAAASRSSPPFARCSCRPLSHKTLHWHHRLGHPSLPRLRGMASRTLVSGLPRSLPPLPPRPAPTCVPCVEGRQCAAPHSSEFPPTEAPLQTLYMDVWGPARVRGQGHEHYFLLVVDDYSRYTTVFPLRSKGDVPEVLIDWIRGARCQLSERFGSDLPVLRLHSDRDVRCASDQPSASCLLAGDHNYSEAPLQTLHMDVWGPARVRGQGHERYFLLVVDDYLRYTTLFPLRSKGEVPEGIRQTFTLPASPQQNGIAERRIGMVMDVACTSMIHAAAPHFLSPFAVQHAAHQINLQPRVSLPETTPTLRWTRKVGDASAFRVWGSRAFVRDTSADKLSSHAFYHPTSHRVLTSQDVTFIESVSYYRLFPYCAASLPPTPLFLAPGRPCQPVEVAVDSGAARGAEPAGAGTGGAEPGGAVPERVESRGAEPERVEPGGAEPGGPASWGAEPACAKSGGSPGVPLRREPLSLQRLHEWYARRCRRATSAAGAGAAGGAASAGAAGGAAGAGAAGGAADAAGVGATGTGTAGVGATGGAASAGAAGGAAGAGAAGGATGAGATGAAGPGGARTGGTGAGGAGGVAGGGALGTGAGGAAGAVTRDPGAEGIGDVSVVSRGAARPRPYYVLLLQQVLGPPPPLLSPPPVQSLSQFQPASSLPSPSPYSGPTRGLSESREPQSRPVSPESHPASPESRSESPVRTVCAGRRVLRPRPPPIPGTHFMTVSPSSAPQRVPLPSPPASSLPDSPDPESDSHRADPLFESTAASALVAELVDFAAACRLDFATSLVAESASASVCPPSIRGESALGTDVLEDRQEEFECFAATAPHLVSMLLAPEGDPDAPDIPTPRSSAEAIEGPYSSQWQAAMDAEMASYKSTGTYIDEVPPPGANIVSGMWIFRVKRPPGSPPVFKARYVACGFILLHVAAHRDYELHSLDFTTAFLQGSLHEEIWLRRPPGFIGSFPAGTQWSLRRLVYGLRQAPREWHDTLRTTLAALGFAPSTADPSLFLRTDTSLPPFYVLVYVHDLVFATADIEALGHVKSKLQKRHTCTDLGELTSYLGLRITWDRAQRTITLTQSHMVQQVLQHFGFMYSSPQSTPLPTGHSLSAPPSDESVEPSGPLGSGSVSWRSTRSSSVLSSCCEAEIYAGAMAAQELRWLTYLRTDLGEAPCSPSVLYVDNKAMLALCQEHRLEHRTKHIALRYFLALELQQRGQLRLVYVASQVNSADVFTKALQPCDRQRFCTVLGLVPTMPHLLTS
ncbi:unnamed protein product [Closterium sp. NIES-54]